MNSPILIMFGMKMSIDNKNKTSFKLFQNIKKCVRVDMAPCLNKRCSEAQEARESTRQIPTF